MKLLLLSICGRDKEPEDLRGLNLYLASLRKHVVPHFNTQVFLFSTFASKEKTVRRVEEFGLEKNISVIHTYDDLGVPVGAAEALKKLNFFTKIGIHMNMLYDFAKQQNFFNSDWIFHTDTDIEFLPNFFAFMYAIHGMTIVNPRLLISCAGDTNPIAVRHKDKNYILTPPERWNAFTTPPPSNMNVLHSLRPVVKNHTPPEPEDTIVFQHKCLKVRNDFVGLSKATADDYALNWVHSHYPVDFRAENRDDPTECELENIWQSRLQNTGLKVSMNEDKGSLVLDWLKTGMNGVTWIQLKGWQEMIHHYGSGWNGPTYEPFLVNSYKLLQEHYADTATIWEPDYITL